jgi:F0F1-type ATP synthase epsilon subunit
MLKIAIIAKDKVVYDGAAISVVVPTKSGIIEVLSEHMQLVSALVSGEIILNLESGKKSFTTSGGVLEVKSKSNVIILADIIEIY